MTGEKEQKQEWNANPYQRKLHVTCIFILALYMHMKCM